MKNNRRTPCLPLKRLGNWYYERNVWIRERSQRCIHLDTFFIFLDTKIVVLVPHVRISKLVVQVLGKETQKRHTIMTMSGMYLLKVFQNAGLTISFYPHPPAIAGADSRR